jgi:two-component system phosphate regulon response regulator OmpR
MSADTPHVLVVDDDRRLRDLLRNYLAQNGFTVATAGDAGEARRLLATLQFDIAVLDIMMPGESGLDLTRHVTDSYRLPVLLLTARGEAEDRIAGFEKGADDYLVKPFEPRELILRIASILRRSGRAGRPAEQSPSVAINGHLFDADRGVLSAADSTIRLTASETALLRVFAAAPGTTIARAELSRRIGVPNERSVDVQITRLRRKIEPDPRNPRHLQTVWGEGYVLWTD